jgi:ParB family chromosome partitioning protein
MGTRLTDRGYSFQDIARKVDLDVTYVRGIVKLLRKGEERLLRAAERREIPLTMAIEIAESEEPEVQRMMTEAYEKKELRGRDLLLARRLLEARRSKGKAIYSRAKTDAEPSTDALRNVHKKETARLRSLVTRAYQADTRLRYVVSAFRKLLADQTFVGILKLEGQAQLPKPLLDQLGSKGAAHAK